MNPLHFLLVNQLLFRHHDLGPQMCFYAVDVGRDFDTIAHAWRRCNADLGAFRDKCTAPGFRGHHIFFIEMQRISTPTFMGDAVSYPDLAELMLAWNMNSVGLTPGFRTFASGAPAAVTATSPSVEVLISHNRGWVPARQVITLLDYVF